MTLTLEEFISICKNHNIPDNAKLESDTAWECGSVPVEYIYYNREKNILYTAQEYTPLQNFVGCELIYGKEKSDRDFSFMYAVDEVTRVVKKTAIE